jgi:hypothetical protein
MKALANLSVTDLIDEVTSRVLQQFHICFIGFQHIFLLGNADLTLLSILGQPDQALQASGHTLSTSML